MQQECKNDFLTVYIDVKNLSLFTLAVKLHAISVLTFTTYTRSLTVFGDMSRAVRSTPPVMTDRSRAVPVMTSPIISTVDIIYVSHQMSCCLLMTSCPSPALASQRRVTSALLFPVVHWQLPVSVRRTRQTPVATIRTTARLANCRHRLPPSNHQ
jgi:hypothetical protein